MELALLVFIVVLQIGTILWGIALKGYANKKGENLATKQDIAELTTITKEVEARFTNEVWDRQQHAVMKRDALFKLLEQLANAEEFLAEFIGMQMLVKVSNEGKDELYHERLENFKNVKSAQRALRHAMYLATVSCEDGISERLDRMYMMIITATNHALQRERDKAAAEMLSLRMETMTLTEFIRKELGIPSKLPPSE